MTKPWLWRDAALPHPTPLSFRFWATQPTRCCNYVILEIAIVSDAGFVVLNCLTRSYMRRKEKHPPTYSVQLS